jgi:hypothetical protein
MPHGRRSLNRLAGLAAPLAVGALIAAPASGHVGERAHNRAVAIRTATAQLRHTPRPARARRLRTEPAGDGHLLAAPPETLVSRALVDRHAVYVVPAAFSRVEAFYVHHVPAHARAIGSGKAGGEHVPRNVNMTWAWPRSRALVTRQTQLDLVALGPHRTGVRIDAQVVWRVLRPAGERVPAGVRAISITRAQPGHTPDLSKTVTGPNRVHAIVVMIDRLPIVQPSYVACPVMLAGTPIVTFTFRASGTGAALAAASEAADVTEPTTVCDALSFSTGAQVWPSLLRGARFLHRVDRMLHAHFATRPGHTLTIASGR